MYCLADWQQTPDGKCPALPSEADFLMLAEPKNGGDFALFEINLSAELAKFPGVDLVSDELRDLLNAAKQYPPAFALAREAVGALPAQSKADFQEHLMERLRHHLDQQASAPYLLVRALSTESGYKYAGDYYWIVGYHPERVGHEVAWISRDYCIYRNPLTDFDVDAAVLQSRFLGLKP